MKTLFTIAFIVLLTGIIGCDSSDSDSFQPNGTTVLSGAVVCPDSVEARSEFHKGIQGQKAMDQIAQSEGSQYAKILAMVQANTAYNPDFAALDCSEIESGVPVYIESEDATGIATITGTSLDGTMVHGITYAREVKPYTSGQQ